ncbi:MAG: aromatic amino acid transaminase [Gammaproteobacteria bacterium]|nr:aromatic amino acid transaminase [Gammaproteobacteria bacterium]
MTASLLSRVEMAPSDPILGITEAFHADTNPKKVNLGVGVYTDDAGKVPLLECVRRADQSILETAAPWSYLPIDGLAAYDKAVQALVFGAESSVIAQGRGVTVQALGGTGALRVCADFLRRFSPDAKVLISDPSWENHRALFESAGFKVEAYPYYDAATHGLDFAGMVAALRKAPAGTIVVLHACCHNPTGVDLEPAHWAEVLEIVKAQGLVPILDSAYQGFAEGVDADGAIVRQFAEACSPVFVASSFSKSFSLYGERVGALSVATASKDEAFVS